METYTLHTYSAFEGFVSNRLSYYYCPVFPVSIVIKKIHFSYRIYLCRLGSKCGNAICQLQSISRPISSKYRL